MTLTQLKYFAAVCNYGKIHTASKNLFVSAPTLSVAIKNLEEELGVSLFVRNNNQMILTDAGDKLLAKAKSILAECDIFENEAQRIKNNISVISVASPSTLSVYLLSKMVSDFMELYPSAWFEIPPHSSTDAVHAVLAGKADFAVCDGLAVQSEQLEFVPFMVSPVCGFVRADHPLAGAKNVTPQMLADEPMLLLNARSMFSSQILHWLRDSGINPNFHLYEYPEIPRITLAAVKQHNAIAFLLEGMFIDQAPEGITTFALDSPVMFRIGLVRRKDRQMSEMGKNFYEYCKSLNSDK